MCQDMIQLCAGAKPESDYIWFLCDFLLLSNTLNMNQNQLVRSHSSQSFGSANSEDECGGTHLSDVSFSLSVSMRVGVTAHGCFIYIFLISSIYSDSQYKSFYEDVYLSDGRLGTVALLRSDCYISPTALPLVVTPTVKDIECVTLHCI